eukprot:TRINITY_DN4415_c0_g1_i1.p1 TRINITY_DN4415_c0_g1~~TRINITY_DN4415_c0_g1_i1.p1  ORF type:complete len:748 (+),score=144.68 TRINITY_DN4415_c0_g1_i1:44-2245(+)
MVAAMIPGGAVTPPFNGFSSALAARLSPSVGRGSETDNFWFGGEQAFPTRAQGCVRSSTTPSRAAAAGYVRQQPQHFAGTSSSSAAAPPRSWRASEPIARPGQLSNDRSPMRYTSRQSASAAFMPAPGAGCLAAPAPIAGGAFAEWREAKASSPERATALETRFRTIVEDQLLSLTRTLDQNLQQRFSELEGRLDHVSLQRRIAELESQLGQEMQLNGKSIEQVDWKAEQAAGSLEQVGLKVEQACAMAEERARQALEAAYQRHRSEFMTISEKRLQEHSDLLTLHKDNLESLLAKMEACQNLHLFSPARASEACLDEIRREVASLRAKIEERQNLQQFSPARASEGCLEEIQREVASLRAKIEERPNLQQCSPARASEACLEEIRQEVASLRSDLESRIGSGKAAATVSHLDEALQELSKLRSDFEGYVASGAFSSRPTSPVSWANQQQPLLEALREAVPEEGAVFTQELHRTTASCHQSNETLLRSHPSHQSHQSHESHRTHKASASCHQSNETLRRSFSEVEEAKLSVDSGLKAQSKGQENLDHARLAARETADLLRSALADYRATSKEMASITVELKSAENQACKPSSSPLQSPQNQVVLAAQPRPDQLSPSMGGACSPARRKTPRLLTAEITPEVPDLPPQGANSAPSLASPDRHGDLVEIVRQAILTDSSGFLDAEKAALARGRRSRSAPAPGRGRGAAVQAGSLAAAAGSSPVEVINIVKAALAIS